MGNLMALDKSVKSFRLKGNRKLLLIIISVLVAITVGPALWFRYENQQFDKVFASVVQPDWQEISRERFGNRLCADACLGEVRTYSASVDQVNLLGKFENLILSAGFRMTYKDRVCGAKPAKSYSSTLCYVEGMKGSLYLILSLNLINKDDPKEGTEIGIGYGHDSYLFGLINN
ncbi:hypothetical protein HY346_01680 [Candidatus Microgenomates bacterium]|nr:hypothetical protein [Candidatus Microgenomates bacterium]